MTRFLRRVIEQIRPKVLCDGHSLNVIYFTKKENLITLSIHSVGRCWSSKLIREINIEEALEMRDALLIDVRSEQEYLEDTIPGAINVPLFNDQERAAVGKVYRHEGHEAAGRLGLKLVAPQLCEKVAYVDKTMPGEKKIVLFCWRGGQRSRFMATVFDAMGYDVYCLTGGYKSYRRYVSSYLSHEELAQKAVVLYGLTGVGKTEVLTGLAHMGLPALDLEGLARHRGSVFGKIGLPSSPSQKDFESKIVNFLTEVVGEEGIFLVECESKRVGNLLVPNPVINSMKKGYRVLLYASMESRVKRIRKVYTAGPGENIKQLQDAVSCLARKIGYSRAEELKRLLESREFTHVFTYLLKNYYDPLYKYPNAPSAEFDLCVTTEDIEYALKKIYDFVAGLKN
ncbi:MAG: putative ATPase [Pelotomaculum thermopropionicum]|uniref:Putative ATPase n=1 Tax=Pelotomaculum thermopropionicum TaxID=110500 RepID=A0A117M4C5_9FIRM|nr:MAG: putative ATPase [Pelotomaculum thermopropionicum]